MHHLSCDLWAMDRNAMRQFLAFAPLGVNTDSELVRASSEPRREKTVAILPVHGVIEARPSFFGSFFGMSSYERIGNAFDSLMLDESVRGVILDVASPGGMVYGAQELANKIYSARGIKPIVAVANPMAASGAYWIAAAADRIVSVPSGDTGSVGVIWEHIDFTQANEKEGVKVTVIRSTDSPHKAEANSLESLTDEAKENMQARADAIYHQFAGDLAKFRGVTLEHVKEHFGKGRLVDSKRAMQAGMIDRVDTLQSVAYKMAAGRVRISSVRSEDNWDAPTDREQRMQRAAALKAIAEQPEEVSE